MRKRTCDHLADTIFWYLLYFLPILSYLLFCFVADTSTSLSFVNFSNYLTNTFDFSSTSFIYDTLVSIFGSNGVFNLGIDNAVWLYFSYFIGVYLAHLMVDFLLFIPRLCHKWLKIFTERA